MRIVHIIPYYQPDYGYEEYFNAYYQAKLGNEVYVLTSHYYNPILKNGRRVKCTFKSNTSIKVIRLKSIEIPRTCQNVLINLNRTIVRLKPDILYLHGADNFTSCQSIVSTIRFECRIISDIHINGVKENQSLIKENREINHIIKRLLMKIVFEKSYKIVVFSQTIKTIVINNFDLNQKRIIVLGMGVSTDRFYPSKNDRKKIRDQLNILDTDLVVIITGRFSPEKKILEIVEAFRSLENSPIKLLLVGDCIPGYKVNLLALDNEFEKKVIFVERVLNSELRPYYNAADIALWVSNHSVSIMDAYACGLTVVLNDIAKQHYPALSNSLVVNKNDYKKAVEIVRYYEENRNVLIENIPKALSFAKKRSFKDFASKVLKSIE